MKSGLSTLSYAFGQALPTNVPLTWKVRGSNADGKGVWSRDVAFIVVPDAPSLTITANDRSKTYGHALTLGGSAFTTVGLLPGDSVTSVTLSSGGAAAAAAVNGSPYADRAERRPRHGARQVRDHLCERQPDRGQEERSRSAARSPTTSSTTAPRTRRSTSPAPASAASSAATPSTIDSSGYSATFDSASAGTGKPVTVTGVALGGADAGNYTVSQPSGLTADIAPPTPR